MIIITIAVGEHPKAIDAWLSLVERCVRDAEVAGSNPVASTQTETDAEWYPFLFDTK